ncbi:Asp23/Gls24 family envelope stress response protein [Actinomadura craniellae]|nr:Asp23/Gls24 family envelope stress response protein [Actinomadura craniellae]
MQRGRPEGDPAGGGRTSVVDSVVAKIASLAAREVGGVHGLGPGSARLGAGGERLPRVTLSGPATGPGERRAAIDLDLVVDYGVSIPDLAAAVRRNVAAEVEQMCGLEVVEVNVVVDDVYLPDDTALTPMREPGTAGPPGATPAEGRAGWPRTRSFRWPG